MAKYLTKDELKILDFKFNNFLIKSSDIVDLTKNDYLEFKFDILLNSIIKISKDKFYFLMYYLYYNSIIDLEFVKRIYFFELSIIQNINKYLAYDFYIYNLKNVNNKIILNFDINNSLMKNLFGKLNLDIINKKISVFDNDLYIYNNYKEKFEKYCLNVDCIYKYVCYFKLFRKLRYNFENYIFNPEKS